MSSTGDRSATRRFAETTVQKAALTAGIIFLLIGILGFIPGVTTNFDQLMFAGEESGALLLGVFQVSVLHNFVHLLFGIVGVAVARTARASRQYLIWGGVVYFVLWLYGLFVPHESMANFVPMNDGDDWLHLVLAIGMVALGLLLGRDLSRDRDRRTA
ncbi:MAG TPA: DUF4383 domain-containing protein [Homoserinimonas sp.]|nr:DUF4383 domain-containing protein [Homoserinimonas sp.]